MHLDVVDLRAFYYRAPLGRAVQRVLRRDLERLWPDTKGMTVVGFGFAAPLLRPYLEPARRVICLMPGPQGVMAWPTQTDNASVLVEEAQWPLATGMADRLVMLHGLEASEDPTGLLDEAFRVLGPGGRAVFVVPNRTGMWSRNEATPFGFGRPFTPSQLEAQLRRHGFIPEIAFSTLFQPPSTQRIWRKSARVMERVGRHIPVFAAGGVLMIEAVKHVSAPTRPGMAERVMGAVPGISAPKTARKTPT